tara:strand:+ start:1024 stop:5901 length:4878 start_codon:yes stop_codon:yes gene_type:complete
MNKKQLAKLLIKHPEIKALYESREFDASTINKIVAEEIMREGEDDESYLDQVNATLEEYQQLKNEIEANRSIIKKLEGSGTLNDEEIEDLEDSKQILKEAEAALKKNKGKFIQAFTTASTISTSKWAKGSQKEKGSKGKTPKMAKISAERIKEIESIVSKAKDALEELNSEQTAEKRITGGSSEVPSAKEEDPAKKELIQSMQSEIEILKSLLSDPDEMPLDKEGYREDIEEYTKKLEQMGVEVATSPSIKDDKAFVKSVTDSKPEIEKAADAVKAAGDDGFAETFPDLDAAIMASLKGSKDAATAANDELDLSDIEIEDAEEPEQDKRDPIDKALEWVETDEAANLFADPVANTLAIGDSLGNLGLDMSPYGSINPDDILSQPKEDVIAVLKQAKDSGDSQVEEPATEEGTAAAVEAIQDEAPVEVANIQPADVEAAKEELKPEIEKDPQKEAKAEELTNKVENKKMAKQKDAVVKKAQDSWNKWKNEAFKETTDDEGKLVLSNIENAEGLFRQELERRLNIYLGSDNWGDLAELGHQVPEDGTLESLNLWRSNNEEELKKYFEDVSKRMSSVKNLDAQNAPNEIGNRVDGLAADALKIQNSIDSAAAAEDVSNDDVGGATVGGTTPAQEIQKVIKDLDENAPEFPTLLGNDRFAELLFAELKKAAPEQPNSNTVDVNDANVSGTANSSDTNLDSNKVTGAPNSNDSRQTPVSEALSGIYLAEEEVREPVDDKKAGETKPGMSVEEATKLRDEIQKMQELFKTSENENIKSIVVMDLAKKAFGEIPEAGEVEIPSVEEAIEQGQNAAQDDAESPDMKYKEMYKGFKEQMDTFFSLDAKNDGFMDQFLLKYQAKALAELLGTLDDIIRGDVPKDKEDNSGEARALSTATQQADNNLNEDQEQSISEKGQLELKTRLVAMLKGLKSLKAMMNSYKKNATRSSANPKLDGSALKKSLQRYMSNLQINIKAIVETCYIEHSRLTQTQSDDVNLNEPSGDKPTQPTADDTPPTVEPPQGPQNEQLYEAILEAIAPALEGVSLMEDTERGEKMEIVNTIYGQMKEEIYLPSMQSALETSQKETAMSNASEMMELAKKEEFVALFPTFTGSFGGKPQTIDQATDAIDGLLRDFIETMKKVIVLAKGATIDETTLSKVIEDLSMMSLMMQNYFGVKSLLDDDMQAKVEKMLAQREENQSLSDDAKPSSERSSGGFMDKAKDLVGKGLEKLKQMFAKLMEWLKSKKWSNILSWFDQNKIEDLLPEGSGVELDPDEVIQTIKDFENEENALEFLQDLEKSTNWYKDLDPRMKAIWDKFIKALSQDQNLQEAYNGFNVISSKLMKTEFKITEEMLNQALGKLEQTEQPMISDIIGNSYDLASSFIYHVLKGTIKLSETSDASNEPMSAEVENEDDGDPSAEGGMPNPTGDSDKDNSELEDVEGFDDSNEEPDDIASPEEVADLDGKELKNEALAFQKNIERMINARDTSGGQTIARFLDTYTAITNNVKEKNKNEITPDQKRIILSNIVVLVRDFTGDLVYEQKAGMKKIKKQRIQQIQTSKAREVLKKYEETDKSLEVEKFFKLIGDNFSDLYSLLKKNSKLIMDKLIKADNSEKLQEALRPIIEKMLNEHYNH